MERLKAKSLGRHGLQIRVNGMQIRFENDYQLYKVGRINRAKDVLREALMQQGVLKAKTIDKILNDPKWAERFINVFDNCESIRECEMLIAQDIAQEITEHVQTTANK